MTIIPLVPALLAGSSNLPGSADGPSVGGSPARQPRWGASASLFGLAPCGVWRAASVASRAVGSYPTFSPFPLRLTIDALRRQWFAQGRFVFCATFRRVAPPGCYPAHCPVEFGLSSLASAFALSGYGGTDSDRPAHCGKLLTPNCLTQLAIAKFQLATTRPVPEISDTAPASYTDYSEAYRLPQRSLRYSRCFRGAAPPDTPAPSPT